MTEEVLEAPKADTDEADFAKGFTEARGVTPPVEVKVEANPEAKVEAKPEAKAEEKVETKAEVKAEEKPAEPKPSGPIVFQSLDEFHAAVEKSAKVTKLEEENRRNFSQYGELKRTMVELQSKLAAGTATRKFTAQTFKRVNEELPGFADALAQDLQEAEAAHIAAGVPFDQEKFLSEKVVPTLEEKLQARITEDRNEVRQLMRIDAKHDGWEEEINSPPFIAWAFANGPTPAEREKLWKLNKSDPNAAVHERLAQATRYPQWWAERGTLIASAEAKDAIKLLDAYKASKEIPAALKEQKKSRLESAVPAQGGATTGGPVTKDDEALFRDGYKEADRRYARS